MNDFEQTPVQRAFSLEDALHIGLDEANKNDIKIIFKNLGMIRARSAQEDLSTYVCSANNNKTAISFLGGGSGSTKLAKVKSLYEALENSLSFQVCSQRINETNNMFSFANSPSTEYLIHQELLPRQLLKNQNHTIPWLQLVNYQEQSRRIFYPLGLIFAFTSHFNSQQDDFISEYSNDTGLAMGATREEAIIHGLNEWIERDAYSLFLLKTVIHQNPEPLRLINKDTLPPDLLEKILLIEHHFNEDLLIVDISSDLSIPAFLVSFTRQKMLIQPTGIGASLSKEVALQQALLEVLQYKDRYNRNAEEFRAESFNHYANYPLIIKAMKCDLLSFIEHQLYIQLSWKEIPTISLEVSLGLQINLVVEKLSQVGADVYCSTLYEGSSGIALTYTLVSGLETFFLIKDAKYSPLKKRGLGVLQ